MLLRDNNLTACVVVTRLEWCHACDHVHAWLILNCWLQEELFRQQEQKLLSQLKASHAQQKEAAGQASELQDALKKAAETVKDCHKTNIALASEKKVRALQLQEELVPFDTVLAVHNFSQASCAAH